MHCYTTCSCQVLLRRSCGARIERLLAACDGGRGNEMVVGLLLGCAHNAVIQAVHPLDAANTEQDHRRHARQRPPLIHESCQHRLKMCTVSFVGVACPCSVYAWLRAAWSLLQAWHAQNFNFFSGVAWVTCPKEGEVPRQWLLDSAVNRSTQACESSPKSCNVVGLAAQPL